jgi:3-oxoacyl-[acyl-carrier protein] reductase
MGKTILLTGASTGIGAGTAEYLADGNTLFLHYNSSKTEAEKVAEAVRKKGGEAHLIQANLMSEEGCISLVDQVKKQTDTLDVLINNAGGLIRRQALKDLEWGLMSDIFTLNTFSTMKITSLCLPLLEKSSQAPVVINVSSIAVRHGSPTSTPYGAAKAAVDAFTRGAAKELAPNIRVNAVAPGVIDTPFHEKVSTPERMKQWKEDTPLKMIGEPTHIALAIEFLMGNRFVTGETIDVNGGLMMR